MTSRELVRTLIDSFEGPTLRKVEFFEATGAPGEPPSFEIVSREAPGGQDRFFKTIIPSRHMERLAAALEVALRHRREALRRGGAKS